MCGVSTDIGRLDWVQQLRGIRSNQNCDLVNVGADDW